jgi:hypothetical protein
VQCVADDENDAAQAVAILNEYFEQRGMNALVEIRGGGININYRPYIAQVYADPDFTGAFEKLRPDFTIPFQKAYGLYRDPRKYLNVSLEINGDRKYLMDFHQENPYDYAKGIYNETKKEWELKPYLELPDGSQYAIWDINQTNNPYVFELKMKKVPPDPMYNYHYTLITTITQPIQSKIAKINNTNDKNNAYPFEGGVWYYYDPEMD